MPIRAAFTAVLALSGCTHDRFADALEIVHDIVVRNAKDVQSLLAQKSLALPVVSLSPLMTFTIKFDDNWLVRNRSRQCRARWDAADETSARQPDGHATRTRGSSPGQLRCAAAHGHEHASRWGDAARNALASFGSRAFNSDSIVKLPDLEILRS
jgi:hypothetical protein